MNHLTDVEVQAVVDGEANERVNVHAAECSRCRERVAVRGREMAAVTAAATSGSEMSPIFEARMHEAIDDGRPARGATRLRVSEPHRRRRAAWISATIAAAAAAVVIFLILPKMGSPTTLSASEVLGKSLQTMTSVKGVELLEYELVLGGGVSVSSRVEHLIDHDRPGRYRFSKYGADGALESTVGQDPATGRRFLLVRADGHGVMVNIEPGSASRISLPEVSQAIIETGISMMQATRDQTLTVQDTPAGRLYVIEMPRVQTGTSASVFDLYSARAVIDGQNFGIQEFEASGSVLRQPYSMSFKLIRRSIRPSAEVPASEFAAPATPSDVLINTTAGTDDDPISDILTAFVRELNRGKGH
jgi:hypothetical protein